MIKSYLPVSALSAAMLTWRSVHLPLPSDGSCAAPQTQSQPTALVCASPSGAASFDRNLCSISAKPQTSFLAASFFFFTFVEAELSPRKV